MGVFVLGPASTTHLMLFGVFDGSVCSAVQVRARADFRFALDPTNMPQNAGERSTIKGLVQTALR